MSSPSSLDAGTLTTSPLTRDSAIEWYRRNRARTAHLFSLLTDDAYYQQPIALRHPVVFYEGHLPGFSLNTLVKRALGRRGIDESLERLFARGIDPDEGPSSASRVSAWPDRSVVRAFVEAADALVLDALANAPLEIPGHPLLHRSEAVYTILEHEAMHQETLLYMWHRLPLAQKKRPAGYVLDTGRAARPNEEIVIARGTARLGAETGAIPFGWDNEHGALDVDVPAFAIDRRKITNEEFAEFVERGGYTREEWWTPEDWSWVSTEGISSPHFWEREDGRWWWRGQFELVPLPADWPVYVSLAEARAFARWRGRRLPTEAEYHRAAYGTPEGATRLFPWGDAEPTPSHGVFDFASWDPRPVDGHPAGRSAWGVDDLLGNAWEWTASVFAPFPGFAPSASYPQYSADFFDGAHYVMKGASPVTGRTFLRPTFRNWFRPRYPYVYAGFRCVRDL